MVAIMVLKCIFFFFLPEIYALSQANIVDKFAIKFMYSVKTVVISALKLELNSNTENASELQEEAEFTNKGTFENQSPERISENLVCFSDSMTQSMLECLCLRGCYNEIKLWFGLICLPPRIKDLVLGDLRMDRKLLQDL